MTGRRRERELEGMLLNKLNDCSILNLLTSLGLLDCRFSVLNALSTTRLVYIFHNPKVFMYKRPTELETPYAPPYCQNS